MDCGTKGYKVSARLQSGSRVSGEVRLHNFLLESARIVSGIGFGNFSRIFSVMAERTREPGVFLLLSPGPNRFCRTAVLGCDYSKFDPPVICYLHSRMQCDKIYLVFFNNNK